MPRKLLNFAAFAAFACIVLGYGFIEWRMSPLQLPKKDAIEHTDKEAHKRASNIAVPHAADEKIADYTWWLSAFTLALVVVSAFQGYFLIRADNTARITASAAQKSADASLAAERARFFIVIEQHNLTEIINNVETRGALASGENFWVRYYFKNYGKTPGIIKELVIDSVIDQQFPDNLPLILSIKDFPEYMIGAGAPTKAAGFSPRVFPVDSQVRLIARNQFRFWLYGRLYYDDVFGNHQVHCFYFRSVSRLGQICVLEPAEPKNQPKST
jgi:hypothetical protein